MVTVSILPELMAAREIYAHQVKFIYSDPHHRVLGIRMALSEKIWLFLEGEGSENHFLFFDKASCSLVCSHLVFAMLRVKLRASCMLGKHSTN